jgi:hypothetical protein
MVRPDPVFGPPNAQLWKPALASNLCDKYSLGRQKDAAELGLLSSETSFRKLRGQAAPYAKRT